MFKHILIPTDGSQLSTDALKQALDFAHGIGAAVTIISTFQPAEAYMIDMMTTAVDHEGHEYAAKAATTATLDAMMEAERRHISTVKLVQLEAADPAAAIIATATKAKCDLIAMGSHGRSGFKALVMGSVTMQVMAQSKIPVLVYR